ncbi:glycerophosphodiester phosphodiesterase [Rhizobium helianthi]|uniref:Glycerophosphodiester phosphodiesterase n=1 Tax=Rhizobium helianthi TaxID=1132695 RepID=A0ABW4M5B1_9HYPH
MQDAYPGLDIFHQRHRTRLKWHRLRRRLDAPLFSAETMADGFRLGASMELDLRVRADGGFVVLHDADLQGETNGQGPVRLARTETIRPLTMKSGGTAPILSEDLAHLMQTAHPQACLQFDMKDDLATIGEAGLAHLERHFSEIGQFMIVSGADLSLIEAIRDRLPNLRRGIDPTDKLFDMLRAEGPEAVQRELLSDLDGPTDPHMVYLSWPLLLAAKEAGLDLVALCHGKGRTVDAWTFNLASRDLGFSEEEWGRFSTLMAMGVDQITTDEAPATERAWRARQ